MAFRCEKCREPQPPCSQPKRMVFETREKSYSGGGVGTEIVREQNLCGSCFAVFATAAAAYAVQDWISVAATDPALILTAKLEEATLA